MSQAVKDQIFEPFFTTKGAHGTGLGLAIVYGIVKRHMGSISVESEEGVGTQVVLLLPATKEMVSDKKAIEFTAMHRGKEVVLVVDDDPNVLQLIKDLLQAYGYTVHTALGGNAALSICTRLNGQIDLVLAAVVMAEINGRDLVDLINQKYSAIKTMFMSGHQDDDLVRCDVLRAQDNLIEKPIKSESILPLVRSILDGRPASSISADTNH